MTDEEAIEDAYARECLDRRGQESEKVKEALDELDDIIGKQTWASLADYEAYLKASENLRSKYCPESKKEKPTLKQIIEKVILMLQHPTSYAPQEYQELLDQLKEVDE